MKRKIRFSLLFLMLLLSGLTVHAESKGYLVQFREGLVSNTEKYQWKAIDEQKGIYLVEALDSLQGLEEYIEYLLPNQEIFLIEGKQNRMSSFSLQKTESDFEQWQLQMIHAEDWWNLETYGNSVKIAVIDSGCSFHEDLQPNLLEGKNYFKDNNDVTDTIGHGTHVSGIIAAEMNEFGINGVAPKAKLVPLKCFDSGETTYMDEIIEAIYDAVDVYQCNIINMSWGLKKDNLFLKQAIEYAHEKGVILIASVGNDGTDELFYPAAYDEVIGVGSVGKGKERSAFSQYNTSVLVAAPGEQVYSTGKDGAYEYLQGTSQAAPFVSGLAAVVLSAKEEMTPTEFRQLLTESAEDLGEIGYDNHFGYGLVNAEALLETLMNTMECYTSPINTTDSDSYILIQNNTNVELNCLSIFSRFENRNFLGCIQTKVTLLPKEKTILKTEKGKESLTHVLWDDLECLTPLSVKREG